MENGLEKTFDLRVFSDLEEALSDRPDVAFICNPSSLHVPVALRAARAGCHLFIEKPLSHNSEAVSELIKLIDGKKLVGMMGYQMRFHPCLQYLHELLSRRAIGEVIAVRAEVGEYLPDWHPYEDYRHMYAAQEKLGGGVLLTQIHEIDYLQWLFGTPRRLLALGGHLSSLEIDVEDVVSILMECQVDGQLIPVHLQQDYIQRPASRTCQVICNDGKILVDLRALTVKVFDDKGKEIESKFYEGFDRNQLFVDEIQHFLACIERQEKPLVSIGDGAQSLQIALAAKQSLSTGQQVELEAMI